MAPSDNEFDTPDAREELLSVLMEDLATGKIRLWRKLESYSFLPLDFPGPATSLEPHSSRARSWAAPKAGTQNTGKTLLPVKTSLMKARTTVFNFQVSGDPRRTHRPTPKLSLWGCDREWSHVTSSSNLDPPGPSRCLIFTNRFLPMCKPLGFNITVFFPAFWLKKVTEGSV